DSDQSSAGINDSQMVLAGNKDGLKRTFIILNSLINKIKNTHIYSDGPNKKFEPLREHKHKFEYE
ncbi:hypothetical protein COBT_004218, partial [Conglomerata obtusa]